MFIKHYVLCHTVALLKPPCPGPPGIPGLCICYVAFFPHFLKVHLKSLQALHISGLKGSVENWISQPKFQACSLRTLLNQNLRAVELLFL